MFMGDSMIVIYCIISVFTVTGAFYIIQSFFKKLYRQKYTCCKPVLLWQISSDKSSDLETDVRLALSGLKWLNLRDYLKVCFVKHRLNDDDERICELLISANNFELVDESELNNIF